MSTPSDLGALVRERSIIVCCGSGGAGKTTTSAAIALCGALAGRSACVVTIDPARRLADALGIQELSNEPKRIEGSWAGELWAVMLDAKGTFDDLVVRYSADPEQAERILSNRLYRNLTSALSGTQEYMAAEKLYQLHASERFDLVVVDTPPTRNALDFLDAPGRLTRFLENRVFRLLLMPTRASLKALTMATQALLRTISKVAGSEIVEDAVAFFRAFDGMEEGFRDRARRVEELLADPGTAFVLVAVPRRDSIDEAGYFADRLAEAHQPVAALVMNRLHPDFGRVGDGVGGVSAAAGPVGAGSSDAGSSDAGPSSDGPSDAGSSDAGSRDAEPGTSAATASGDAVVTSGAASAAGVAVGARGETASASADSASVGATTVGASAAHVEAVAPIHAAAASDASATEAEPDVVGDARSLDSTAAEEALAGMRRNLADLLAAASYERGYLEKLESKIDGAVVTVPFLPKDVHDLDGLAAVAEYLTGQVLSRRA
ncbi:MAG: ArsA family ATPase [Acidimicrobiales bacterium]|jgi:anion-transporting  ArsA/GET3 family ATPase